MIPGFLSWNGPMIAGNIRGGNDRLWFGDNSYELKSGYEWSGYRIFRSGLTKFTAFNLEKQVPSPLHTGNVEANLPWKQTKEDFLYLEMV